HTRFSRDWSSDVCSSDLALSSSRRFKRLLRLITRRYKSFRSEVAKRPPSNGTKGRKSGGRTGNTVITIQRGSLPELWNDSNNLRRLESSLILVSELVCGISSLKVCASSCRSI